MKNSYKYSAYVLEKYTDMRKGYTTPRFVEEARYLGIDLKVIGVHDLIIEDEKVYHNNSILEKRDIVMIRQKQGHLINQISELGHQCFNDPIKVQKYKDKFSQYKTVYSSFINQPRSVLGHMGFNYKKIVDIAGSPFVVKGLSSSQGKEVYLVKNEVDYSKLVDLYSENLGEVLFQEFISTNVGNDLRVFVVKGEVIGCMKRSSKDSFKANFALGSSVTNYDVDDEIREIVKELYRLTGLFYMGVDLMFGKNGYIFCELNITPGIEGIEQATNVNIAREVMIRIKDVLK